MTAPHTNVPAERAVIAALIRREDAARVMIDLKITPDLFTGDRLPAYPEIHALLLDGTRPDAATLRQALDNSTLIEAETTLSEHASGANIAAHVGILKECRRARQVAAIREQMKSAIDAGASGAELTALALALEDLKAGAEPAKGPVGWINAAELLKKKFPDPVWLLPDLLPEVGCYLLSGKPKKGKSWWSLGLAMAVAQGGRFLDRDVPAGNVLVLALEDTERRLNSRLQTLQPDCIDNPSCLARLDLRTEAPRLGAGLEQLLETALTVGGVRLVIIDTLQKVRPAGGGRGGNQYELDYAAVSALKVLADRHGVVFLIIHHLRKQEADDVQDCVSGTLGITGAADGSLILERQHGDGGTLHVVGRDMDETALGMRIQRGMWTYAGTAEEVKASDEQNEVFQALHAYGSDGATVKQICDDTGKQRRNASKLLGKLVTAERVRIRHTKPAPHYAICDGSTSTPPPQEREEDRKEKDESAVPPVPPVPCVPPVPPVPPPGKRADKRRCGTAGTLEGAETGQPGTRLNTGIAGSGGTAGTAGTAGTTELTQFRPSPTARRILERLASCPTGVADDELKRALANGKGTSPAMIDAELSTLVKAGLVARNNERWIKMKESRHG